MSRVLIQHYLSELSGLRQVSGTHRESVVREGFKDLLKSWGRTQDLTFVPEYEIESSAKELHYVDGALLCGLQCAPRYAGTHHAVASCDRDGAGDHGDDGLGRDRRRQSPRTH